MRRLLLVPMISWAFFSLACQKKDSDSEDTPPSNIGDASLQNPLPPDTQNPGGQPGSSNPNPPGTTPPLDPGLPRPIEPGAPNPAEPVVPAPVEPVPVEGVTKLRIQSEGAFLIGHNKKLRAIAQYEAGTEREAPAQWTLISNEASATLDAKGYLRAKKIGKVVVRAEFGNQSAEAEYRIEEPLLRLKEDQFWVYKQNGEFLSFNSPWDKTAGHAIQKSMTNIPDFAKACLEEAKQRFSVVQNEPAIKERFGALIGGGATVQLIFLVNVVPVDGRRAVLRRLDRDPYFWHWTRQDLRPSLSMSVFQQGSWVWEVVASPGECAQPDTKEIQRYLDYVAVRLVHVQ